jgi:Kef-type K+ transport system membrane component KefB/Trk K+ transport system NAD-binding subunit
MEDSLSFISLLIVLLLAFLVPLALSRFKQLSLPIVVGEILAGILIGRSGLGLVQIHDPVLDLLSEFGFVFLMFLSGMEIDFSSLGGLGNGASASGKKSVGPVTLGGLSFVVTLLISTGAGYLLVSMGLARNPWMIALILSTTSLGVVLPVLKERGLSSGRYGQTLLVASLIADFATMLLITVLVALLSEGLTLDILLIGLLFVAFFVVHRFASFIFNQLPPVRRVIEELSHATSQIKIRAAFTMMLIFVVLSDVLGAEVILGAFLAGVIISLLMTPQDEELGHQLEAIGFGFFIPIFFIMVGVNFNLNALLSSSQALLLLPVFLVLALVVKLVSGLLFRLSFSWRETWAAGVLLSARLSLIIAASAIGLRLGIISDSVNAAIILVAIITVTFAPPIFLRILPEIEEREPRPIVVVSAGPLGLQVAENMRSHNEFVILIDEDQEHLERARSMGFEVQVSEGGLGSPDLAACLDRAKSVVCTYNDTEKNYRACQQARSVYGIDHVVAYVVDPSLLSQFEQIGVKTMNAAMDHPALLSVLTRNPGVYDMLTRTNSGKEVTEVVVHKGECTGKLVRDLELPGDVLILALNRKGELVVPHGNTRLNEGDRLTLVGSQEYTRAARQFFDPT